MLANKPCSPNGNVKIPLRELRQDDIVGSLGWLQRQKARISRKCIIISPQDLYREMYLCTYKNIMQFYCIFCVHITGNRVRTAAARQDELLPRNVAIPIQHTTT